MDDVHAKGAQGELRMQVSMTINGLVRTLLRRA
jgi:hypothetical protein